MIPFDRLDFVRFLDLIKGLNIRLFADTYSETAGNIVNIRHDVDANIQAAVSMAKAEHEAGIKSTYFILDTAQYWRDKAALLRALGDITAKYGHDIGWHNNFITRCYELSEVEAVDITRENIGLLRKFGPVIGTASHGDRLCHDYHYLNYQN